MIEEIYYDNRSEKEITEDIIQNVEKAVQTAASFFEFENGYQVSVSFVDNDEIQSLNASFRGVDRATDVLSFPLMQTDPRGVDILGDIVLCLDAAQAQAQEFGHGLERELAYLSVHSFLHLMGYDHIEEEDKAEMRAMEKEIMKALGIFKNTEVNK